MQSQLEGQQIGRYLIRQRLGGGGVASVYQAYDQVSGQSVALKVLPPNPDSATLDRFRREALVAGSLRHPHIVRIMQIGTAAGGTSAYIAMDLVEGESLASLLARHPQLGPTESCALLAPIARALAFAHSHGVVHRDVKPSNILLRPLGMRGEGEESSRSVYLEVLGFPVVPLLSDFGIARYLDAPELTSTGRTVGTPAFMAPEQCMGSREIDGRADIYSLGTVLYRCVTGRLPFNGSTTQVLHAQVFEPVVIDEETVRNLPAQVVAILRNTLAKTPEERYQSAEEVAQALAEVAGDKSLVNQESAALDGATSTMTLAQVASVGKAQGSATQNAVQVLVPGATEIIPAAALISPPSQFEQKRSTGGNTRRGPKLERVIWSAFFMLLLAVGGAWSANSWLRGRDARESEPILQPFVLMTFTPTPVETVATAATVSTGVGSVVATATPVAASPTPSPTETLMPVTPMPVTPASVATATSAPVVVVETPTPTASARPVGDALPTVEQPGTPVAPQEALVGVCAMVVDEFLMPSVSQLTGPLQREFACPTAAAHMGAGEWMPFARGMMVAVEGEPLIFVFYENGSWEQVARDMLLPPNGSLPADRPVVPMPFARVLATGGRHLLLGEPLQSEPNRGLTVVQRFIGGVALGNQANGQVLFLARSQLRF